MDELTRRVVAAVADGLDEVAAQSAGAPMDTSIVDMSRTLLRFALAPEPEVGDENLGPETLIRRLMAAEREVVGALSPREAHLGRDHPRRLTTERVAAYLATRGDPRWQRPVAGVSYLPGGFSKETIVVRLKGDGGNEDLVIRKVADAQPLGTLPEEWEMLRVAYRAGVPVPAPFWLELDPAPLGNAFFVVSHASGKNLGDVWGRATDVSADVGFELAGALARLHQVDVGQVGATPAPPMATSSQITEAIDGTVRLVQAVTPVNRQALFDAVIAWLREHTPPPPARAALLHGDVGFHNMLIDGGRISAILDWERAHVGDPTEELAYLRPSLEGTLAWDEFIRAYVGAGGQQPDPDAFRFFEVWRDVWRATACLVLRHQFTTGAAPTLSNAVAGLTYYPRFVLSAAETAFGPEG